MQLKFPLLGGGSAEGINDAGIETFEGDFATNIVRECTQNSLDAAKDHSRPVVVTISWHRLPSTELPFIVRLRDVLKAARKFWGDDAKAIDFFKTAEKAVRDDHIDALRISDSNTTGLDGSDSELRSRWVGLVKSRGSSVMKDPDSGGAFGIGKDAALAGSLVRTALYSTKTVSGDVAFQGVCRLVTHIDEDGQETQATGFIGRFEQRGPKFLALRKKSEIPSRFLRKDPGLDIWLIACRRPAGDGWEKPFIRSALANFWPAIADAKVQFLIGDHRLDQSNLGDWMESEKHVEPVESAYPFFRSVNDAESQMFKEQLPHAGKCRLHLLFGDKDLPRKVCMVRRTGMVIDYYSPKVGFVPFSGLFVCEDRDGNKLLRSLEPPRHDKFDIERAKTAEARKALLEARDWIKKTIKDQTPNRGEERFNLSEVPPELLETDDDLQPPAPENQADENDIGGTPAGSASSTPVGTIRAITRLGRKGVGTSGEEEGTTVERPGKGKGTRRKGKRKRKRTGKSTSSANPVPVIDTRAYLSPSDEDIYELVLRTNIDFTGDLFVRVVGDSGQEIDLPIQQAFDSAGRAIKAKANCLLGLTLSQGTPLRVSLRYANPGKYSIAAYTT